MNMIPSIYKEKIKQLILSLIGNTSCVPRGFVGWFHLTEAPEGWVICDGSTITLEDGSTITTPNLIGRYPLGSIDEIGNTVEAGLPPFDGVMYTHTHGTANINDTDDTNRPIATKIDFDATNDSHREPVVFQPTAGGVYGSSDTVTPPSTKLLPCMKL